MKSLKIIVFYDNWCPMCIGIKGKIEKLDWFHLVDMVGFRDKKIDRELNIPVEDLENRMHAIILRNGSIVSGINAFISISWRIPLSIPFWPLLKVLKCIGLGQIIYDYIAKSRSVVPVGKCNEGSCNLKN
ncbi:thiol-disulfide oxidoreductase DCC family protein [Scopulibacillus cellulosilyticus]|uniref:Thiol-disulfide oxidoreductase DCC family protein n=1 Tax=Scopulibacillus cellulosilyticus TaxID=2665665 RepID=A0ABW2PY40_9BACL